jgi:hypothetical protein
VGRPAGRRAVWRNPILTATASAIWFFISPATSGRASPVPATSVIATWNSLTQLALAPSKAQVLRKFDDTIAQVAATAEQQSECDCILPYTAEREPQAATRNAALFRCALHSYHHLGQIIYLCRELSKS